ncbi:IS110 family transposase [Rhizorhapis sp. SPR117]|uniref:IS110 family transposase n=1 Tax=Rhizorhapis sp. SPR117 TaxID=2912611 RepID=UPI001F01D4D8|nr:IS110 family transposase [Rhizorhapis sp. SPR117]
MAYIGVDLHQNSVTTCRREVDGSERFETWPLSPDALEHFCLSLDADDELAVEATGNSAWFRDEVVSCVGRVVVVNPRQFQIIRKSVKKTDRNDARALALFLSKDMLPETRLKTKPEGELASLVQTRDLLVKQRTRLLNKIHALHNRHGIKLKKEGLASRKRLMALGGAPFSALEQVELEIVRDQALSLTAALTRIDDEIETAASTMDGFEGLTSIKGVGARSAAVFLSGLGSMADFATPDKLAAYVGIVPRVSQSNETDNRGRITKAGNRLVRTTLVQCTLIAIRYSPYLKGFYTQIRDRRGAGKAIIATARKLLTIIYNTLKNQWVFNDFTTFSIRENPIPTGQTS